MPLDALPSRQGRFTVLRDPGTVWRVGYRPDPWTWTPWQYAHHGRFNGRWDDPHGRYRTLYTGLSLLGCLLEVLTAFRPDPHLAGELDDIAEDPDDAPARRGLRGPTLFRSPPSAWRRRRRPR